MRGTFIYGLLDPRNQEIRYVGKTNNPQYRISGHINEGKNPTRKGPKAIWIREVLKEGLTPELVIIECVDENDWEAAEQYWVDTCISLGHRLTNQRPGGMGGYCKPNEKTPLRWWSPEIGVHQSPMLTGAASQTPEAWEKMLGELGLELTVKEKE